MNRVVITGYGVTSPIGNDADSFLNSLKEGTNGIAPITKFDASEIANEWICFRSMGSTLL